MQDLQRLYQTIDQLLPDELAQLEHYIEQRRQQVQQSQDNLQRLADLQAALAEFRAGMTVTEWQLIADAMNTEKRADILPPS